MLPRCWILVVALQTIVSGRFVLAQGQPATDTAPLPTTQPIPKATLLQMYQRELGKLYKPADAEKLYQAHQVLEQYFSNPEARKSVHRALETFELDPNILGRLARIRMGWPN